MSISKTILKIASYAASVLPSPVKKTLYKIPFLAKIIRRTLNASVSQGFSQVTIAGGGAKGLKMILDLQLEKDYWLGTYETDLQTAAQTLIKPGYVIYDVGANIGYVSLLSAQLIREDGKVFSFEALPENIERLRKNVLINDLESRIFVTHAAIIDSEHPVTFLTHASGSMGKAQGSAGRDEHYSGSITVPGKTLDFFIYEEGHPVPDVVKIDIEGGEGRALLGMTRLLSEAKPLLLIELHGEEAARQVWDELSKYGYCIHQMIKDYPIVRKVSALNWKAYIIAIKKNEPIR